MRVASQRIGGQLLGNLGGSIVRVPAAIGIVDSRWRVRRVSHDIEGLLGYQPAECMGAGVLVAVHRDDLPVLLIALGHAIERQEGTSLRLRLWHKQEGWAPAQVLISPLSPGSPFPFGFVIAPPDDTASSELESRLLSLEVRMRRIAGEVESARAGLDIPRDTPSGVVREVAKELSERQAQIVERLLRGRRVSAIAGELGISSSTVRNHLSQLFRKLGVSSQAELVEMLRQSSRPAIDAVSTTK